MVGGAERGKFAQGTIKILLGADFTSDLTQFLHNIADVQLNIRGAPALPKRYKVTPMLGTLVRPAGPDSSCCTLVGPEPSRRT